MAGTLKLGDVIFGGLGAALDGFLGVRDGLREIVQIHDRELGALADLVDGTREVLKAHRVGSSVLDALGGIGEVLGPLSSVGDCSDDQRCRHRDARDE